MAAIKDNHKQRQLTLLILLAVWFMFIAGSAGAIDVPVKSIAQISVDDDGHPLNYPSAVFFDPVMDEVYLVNGGNGRVVLYGPDFFPRGSIGGGRGVMAPRGGTVLKNGKVLLAQIRNVKNPSPRITILNGAFFVDIDILLDEIPEAAGFTPRQLSVSSDGIIYLAGDNMRGVLVLDNEGYFLRRLQPTDEVDSLSADYVSQKEATEEVPAEGDDAEIEETNDEFGDIPEEFRPRQTRRDRISGEKSGVGPVKVNYVKIDSKGRIYLISAETGKIYVYGSDEKFLFSFGTKGGSPGQQSQPRALTIDEERELIYVVDYMRHTVLTYNSKGEFLFELGGRGNAPGWFNFPNDITINRRGEIIVADLFNRRVQVLEVGYDASYFKLEDLPSETSGDASDSIETLEQDGLSPGRPDVEYQESPELNPAVDDVVEAQPEPEIDIEVEILPEEKLPGYPE